LFQKWSKSVQDKWPKGRVAFVTEKKTTEKKTKHFGTLSGTPGAIYPIFV